MTLQELFDCAAEKAAEIFNETGSVCPMWHAVPDKGQHLIIATPWESAEDKATVTHMLRELFKRERIKRYAFMGEAWTATVTSMPEVREWVGNMHQHPDRREILAIHAEDDDGNQRVGFYYILRPEHGPAKLSPLHISEATTVKGQLMGLLQ